LFCDRFVIFDNWTKFYVNRLGLVEDVPKLIIIVTHGVMVYRTGSAMRSADSGTQASKGK